MVSLDDYNYVVWLQSIIVGIYRYGGPVLIVGGTIGTIFCLIVYTKKELRHNPCSIYLSAYNISNLLLFYTSALLAVLSYGYDNDLSRSNLRFCHFRFYCMFLFDILSPSYLILASIDRILITSSEAQTRRKSTIRLAFICIFIVTIFWSLVHIHALILPDFVAMGMGITICYFTPDIYLMISGFYSLIFKGLLIPLLMIIFGLWAIMNVRKLSRTGPTSFVPSTQAVVVRNTPRSSTKDRQLIKILFIDIITYIVFNVLNIFALFYQQFGPGDETNFVQSQLKLFLVTISIFSTYIPYAISLYTHIFTSKLIRNKLKKLIFCK